MGHVETVRGRRQVLGGLGTRRRVSAKGWGAMLGKQVLLGAAIALALVGATGVAASAGSGAAQIGGTGTFDIPQSVCDRGVAARFSPLVLTGDLNGCWYTDSFTGTSHPSGTYQETGTETFIGCLADGTTCGTFGTTYRFEAKFAPDGLEELRMLPAPDRFRKWHRGLRGRVWSSRLQGRRRCRDVQVSRPPEGGCGLDVSASASARLVRCHRAAELTSWAVRKSLMHPRTRTRSCSPPQMTEAARSRAGAGALMARRRPIGHQGRALDIR